MSWKLTAPNPWEVTWKEETFILNSSLWWWQTTCRFLGPPKKARVVCQDSCWRENPIAEEAWEFYSLVWKKVRLHMWAPSTSYHVPISGSLCDRWVCKVSQLDQCVKLARKSSIIGWWNLTSEQTHAQTQRHWRSVTFAASTLELLDAREHRRTYSWTCTQQHTCERQPELCVLSLLYTNGQLTRGIGQGIREDEHIEKCGNGEQLRL